MFESNIIDFDQIFDDNLQSANVINTKRAIENEVCSNKTNKKFCLGKDTNMSEKKKLPETKLGLPSPNKRVVLRKFPGPAGLLPERRDFTIDIKALEVSHAELKQDNIDMDICSQMSVKAFQEGPWGRMSKDFHSNNSNLFLPDKYNITWIKEKVKNNKLINQKAPFVAAIIQNIECSKLNTAGVTILLKDTTGQIHGTIIYDLYEEYVNELKVGSVIVLKQFGVLTTDHGCNVYITITPNNLVAIYSNDTNCIENISKVNVTTIQEFSVDDFIKNINEVKMSAKKMKYSLSSGENNLNIKPSVQKSQIQHVNNNKCSTPIKSWSSSDVTVKCNDRNIQNVSTPRNIVFPSQITTSNNINSNSKTKFNFKAFKSNNIKTTELVSENKDMASKNLTKNTQISIVANDNEENIMILENVFNGIDADLLFEDF
ncbi:hypothetical protein ILUMI_24275 [Ignelater luminosus]|uniref:Homologous recombination OB-fold protein OB-fold domain-containing protein n=1 Tax=Ignelater luminosus TaxID=2038154 RepID=A0A8K0G150_IGNLU|nr:hypothetical protein ILUMI_24275 [Ignelater luminosus]